MSQPAVCSPTPDPGAVLALLRTLSGAATALLIDAGDADGTTRVVARSGAEPAVPLGDLLGAGSGSAARGVDVHELPDGDRVVLVHAADAAAGTPTGSEELATALALLATATRAQADAQELRDLTERMNSAQQLANMGDYDWHIASDTNRWSDQLYRIYGYEPGAFNASYDRFLQHIHPDDRERITGVHQAAYASGEPYHMLERIVRPDGEVRYLESNGQVITGDDGRPVRMRGTCVDVTDRVLAEQRSEAAAAVLGEAQTRRRQALQINDTVVQGLAAAAYALQSEDTEQAEALVDRTLTAARRLVDDWLDPLAGAQLQPGDLVRDTPSSAPLPAAEPERATLRALVVDDDDDIRSAIRRMLDRTRRFEVVGVAADGAEALDLAAQMRPDVVFLDLAMPVMDGFQALPLLLGKVPGVRIVVLSGFGEHSVAQRVLELGAYKYIEKGTRVDYRALADELAASAR